MTGRRLLFTMVVALATLLLALPVAAQDEVYFPTEEWRTSTPEEQGMDSASLADVIARLPGRGVVDSLVIVRNGYVVAEVYWNPFTEGMDHHLWSASKTVAATLVGIAIEQGYIASVDETALSFFPEYMVANLDENKRAMTIRDLLNMRSGFDCSILDGTDPADRLSQADDSIQFALDWPMSDVPGMTWRYCQHNPYLLLSIVERATGIGTMEFAEEQLFVPLGITHAEWISTPQGIPYGWAGLYLKPMDMARIAYLYLQNGRWNGQQIISEEWVEQSKSGAVNLTSSFMWWAFQIEQGDFYSAVGLQGQFFAIFPEYDLLVAMVCSGEQFAEWESLRLPAIMPGIVNAIESDAPLPENPAGVGALEASVQGAANPSPLAGSPLPELAAQISGKIYNLETPMSLFATRGPLYPHDLFRVSGEWEVKAIEFEFDAPQAAIALVLSDDSVVDVPLGLDGVFRQVELDDGIVASRGQWSADGTRFTTEVRFLMNSTIFTMDCAFPDGRISCQLDTNLGVLRTISGRESVTP